MWVPILDLRPYAERMRHVHRHDRQGLKTTQHHMSRCSLRWRPAVPVSSCADALNVNMSLQTLKCDGQVHCVYMQTSSVLGSFMSPGSSVIMPRLTARITRRYIQLHAACHQLSETGRALHMRLKCVTSTHVATPSSRTRRHLSSTPWQQPWCLRTRRAWPTLPAAPAGPPPGCPAP